MSKGPFVIFGIFAAICVVAIPYLALSNEGSADAAPITVESYDEGGKELFTSNCGACHTLAAAGTEGVVGPNLDDRLAPGGSGNFEGSYAQIIRAVACGAGSGVEAGGGLMPAGILEGENAQEVAAFVGAYAGQLGEGAEPLADTRTASREPAPSCPGADEAP